MFNFKHYFIIVKRIVLIRASKAAVRLPAQIRLMAHPNWNGYKSDFYKPNWNYFWEVISNCIWTEAKQIDRWVLTVHDVTLTRANVPEQRAPLGVRSCKAMGQTEAVDAEEECESTQDKLRRNTPQLWRGYYGNRSDSSIMWPNNPKQRRIQFGQKRCGQSALLIVFNESAFESDFLAVWTQPE